MAKYCDDIIAAAFAAAPWWRWQQAPHPDRLLHGESAPLKRPAQPVEMAPIYVLLASTESSYVTGMIYGATGGQLMP